MSFEYLSSSFATNSADATVSRMLGLEPSKQVGFCCECARKLVGEAYQDPRNPEVLYCADHAGAIATSDCQACRKPIVGKFCSSDGKKWHLECFSDAHKCGVCKQGIMGQAVSGETGHWHKLCFRCTTCKEDLKETFMERDGLPYCTRCGKQPTIKQTVHCSIGNKGMSAQQKAAMQANKEQAEKNIHSNMQKGKLECAGCGEFILDLEAFSFGGESYHKDCFCCCRCCNNIEPNSAFVAREDGVYCKQCAVGTTVCDRCHKELSGAYVKVAGKAVHKECFKCALCSVSLAGSPYGVSNGKEVCAKCMSASTPSTSTTTTTSVQSKQAGFTIDPITGRKKWRT